MAEVTIHPEAPRVEVEQFRIERRDKAGGKLVIRGDVYRAESGRNATGVVLCHGFKGFGRWGFYPYLAPHIAAAGLNAVTFDLSGSGVGEDRETYTERTAFATNTYEQELADVGAVVEEAKRREWIGARYGMFGHSRGGGDAILHSARSPNVGALVTWAAISHVLRWLPNAREEWRERGYVEVVNSRTGDILRLDSTLLEECERDAEGPLNLRRAAAQIKAPWLLMHGGSDDTVPVADAHELFEAAGGKNARHVEFELIEGANHVFGAAHPLGAVPATLRDVVQRTAGFFAAHLS